MDVFDFFYFKPTSPAGFLYLVFKNAEHIAVKIASSGTVQLGIMTFDYWYSCL